MCGAPRPLSPAIPLREGPVKKTIYERLTHSHVELRVARDYSPLSRTSAVH